MKRNAMNSGYTSTGAKLLHFFMSQAISTFKNISCKKNNREAIELHNSVANKFKITSPPWSIKRFFRKWLWCFAWLKSRWTRCNTQAQTSEGWLIPPVPSLELGMEQVVSINLPMSVHTSQHFSLLISYCFVESTLVLQKRK